MAVVSDESIYHHAYHDPYEFKSITELRKEFLDVIDGCLEKFPVIIYIRALGRESFKQSCRQLNEFHVSCDYYNTRFRNKKTFFIFF